MNGDQIFRIINEIASTSSKNEKLAMVKNAARDAGFVRVIEYSYNPFKTYGIAALPKKTVGGGIRQFDETTWEILDDLISRSLTGALAYETVEAELNCLTEDSAELFKRIIRKDLRAGFSESTCNKAVKGLIPEFPYMRCSLPKDTDLETWPWASGVISQEKADGMFANCDHEASGLVAMRSRQGTEFPMGKLPGIEADVRIRTIPGHQMHGEVVVMRDGILCKREDGNGVMNHVLSGGDFAANEKPVYMIWDQIPLSAVVSKGTHEVGYRHRLIQIVQQLNSGAGDSVALIPTRTVKSLAEAKIHAAELMKSGKEGTVIKHPEAIWKDGTSKEQIKIKLEFEVDLRVIGVVSGREGTKNEGRAGSLACMSEDGLLLVDVAVKNEAMRNHVDMYPEMWIDSIITVIANDIMLPSESSEVHSLFLPRMVEAVYRTDKTAADTLQRIIDQKQAAIYGEETLKETA